MRKVSADSAEEVLRRNGAAGTMGKRQNTESSAEKSPHSPVSTHVYR